jgi:DeoR/GlpR family transcriptional regulator of sugar metabolism
VDTIKAVDVQTARVLMGPIMELTAQQRRSTILDELTQQHSVRIAELSLKLGVSPVLIRRDLARLHQQGLVKRIHGGAVALPNALPAADVHGRAIPHLEEKERIGQAAGALIREGDRLAFESGTTSLQVARHIPGDLLAGGRLTAITISLPIVQELGPWKGVQVLFLGGIYLPDYQSVVGPQTIDQIRGLHVDKMFVGADGLTVEHGVTTANVLEAEVERALIRAASQVIVVADSSKIGHIGLATVIPLNGVHILVTGKGAPPDFVAGASSLGVQVLLV